MILISNTGLDIRIIYIIRLLFMQIPQIFFRQTAQKFIHITNNSTFHQKYGQPDKNML